MLKKEKNSLLDIERIKDMGILDDEIKKIQLAVFLYGDKCITREEAEKLWVDYSDLYACGWCSKIEHISVESIFFELSLRELV